MNMPTPLVWDRITAAYNAARPSRPLGPADRSPEGVAMVELEARHLLHEHRSFETIRVAVGYRPRRTVHDDGSLCDPLALVTLRHLEGIEDTLRMRSTTHRKIPATHLQKYWYGDGGHAFSRNPQLATAQATLELAVAETAGIAWPQLDHRIAKAMLTGYVARIPRSTLDELLLTSPATDTEKASGDRSRSVLEIVDPVRVVGDAQPTSLEDQVVCDDLRRYACSEIRALGGADNVLRADLLLDDFVFDAMTTQSDQRFAAVAEAIVERGLPSTSKPLARLFDPHRDRRGCRGNQGRTERLLDRLRVEIAGTASGIAAA